MHWQMTDSRLGLHRVKATVQLLGLAAWLAALPALSQPAAPAAIGWRGDGTGVVTAQPALEWSSEAKKNILWRVQVGAGYSSPVAAAGRVFLASEPDRLVCVETARARVAWERTNGLAQLPGAAPRIEKLPNREAGHATPTPVTDGKFVYASFGTGIVVCYDLAGQRRWMRQLDAPPGSSYGRGASPILCDGKLLVVIGCVTALDPATGQTFWSAPEAGESFGTPAVARIGGVPVVVTGHGDCVRVSDGALLETALGATPYTSPVVAGGVVFLAGPQTVAAQLPEKLEGKPEFKRLWMTELEGDFFSSPVLVNGLLYVASNQGMLHALDARTGELVYQAHLDIPSQGGPPGTEPASIYPSLVSVAGTILVSNDKGDTLVIAPGREFKPLRQNGLEQGSAGTPAFEARLLFMRGGPFLYCIGDGEKQRK